MDPIEPISVTATATVNTIPAPIGIDPFSFFLELFGGSEGAASFFSGSGIGGILGVLWNIFAFLALLISAGMLVLYAYASSRRKQYYELGDKELRDEEKKYDELYRGVQRNSRIDDVLKHSISDNPNDWKLAIIEADIILDQALEERGYTGSSLGERLKSISPQQFSSLQDAWEAHKVRNRIAHDGADFVLTKRAAEETINRYRRVFNELGV